MVCMATTPQYNMKAVINKFINNVRCGCATTKFYFQKRTAGPGLPTSVLDSFFESYFF